MSGAAASIVALFVYFAVSVARSRIDARRRIKARLAAIRQEQRNE